MQFLFLGQNLDHWHYEPGYYYVDLKHLVEETYRSNGGRKVVLAAFYTGGIYAMTFLNHHAWKDEYIASLVTIGTPWLGTVGAILPYFESYSYIKQCVKGYCEKYESELESRTLDTEEQLLKELPSTAFHCIFGYGFQTLHLKNTTVDGDGYVPRKSAEYCQILQQGADGDRVHVRPINKFYHFAQSTYARDAGTAELM
uniref:Uncharacterized protein n=1 Tax=Romanomermis culicivorax TaxID=13658 RepID=A0A915HFX2_ROMCU